MDRMQGLLGTKPLRLRYVRSQHFFTWVCATCEDDRRDAVQLLDGSATENPGADDSDDRRDAI